MMRQLAVCESGAHGDSDRPIYGGRGAYVGRFQFDRARSRKIGLARRVQEVRAL
jgi:hypothetical protein